MPIDSKECFTNLTLDGQLYEIYQAAQGGGGGGGGFPTGTGVVKVVGGVVQSPATTIVNSDVSASAAIEVSKLSQATARILGRTTAGTGAVEEITVGTGLSLSAGTLSANNIAPNSQSASYTLQLTDAGKYINISTGGVTVPSAVFASGDVISVYNNSSANQTITQGSGVTMYLAGTSNTGNRTLSQRGVATILCVGSNTFTVIGGGLS